MRSENWSGRRSRDSDRRRETGDENGRVIEETEEV
jgi:hypothetical protein